MSAAPRPNETPKPQVLMIDDEDLVRRAYVRILTRSYAVSAESSAGSALERFLCGERWDAIACDVRLGLGMSGVEFIERVRG